LPNIFSALFLSYYPLKQGLKQYAPSISTKSAPIFILLSIKTRIETEPIDLESGNDTGFLSYYPLKQGLKRFLLQAIPNLPIQFLSYYPLKQGLEH